MDPLVKLKLAVLGALVKRLDEADRPISVGFSELNKAPGVEVHADPSSKTVIVTLEEDGS